MLTQAIRELQLCNKEVMEAILYFFLMKTKLLLTNLILDWLLCTLIYLLISGPPVKLFI